MDWLTGSKQSEVRRLIAQLADSTKQDATARDLIRIGDESVPLLIESLQNPDLHRVAIYQQILARISSASPTLIKALSSAHPVVRARVADVFGINKDKSTIAALADALRGQFFTVRAQVALALGNIGDAKVVPALLPLLKDSEAKVRAAACIALGKLKSAASVQDIATVLMEDPIIEVRQAAALSLGEVGTLTALLPLIEALSDSFWWYEREQAVSDLFRAIERFGSQAIPFLVQALQARDATVRKFAAQLLGRIKDEAALESLAIAQYDLHHEVGLAAAEALAEYGSIALDILGEATLHPEAWIRIHALTALAKMNDMQAVELILRLLQDPDRDIRRQAIISLGRKNDTTIRKPLEAIANDRSDRELALLAREAMKTST